MKHRHLRVVNSLGKFWGKSPCAAKKMVTRNIRARQKREFQKELNNG